MVLKIAADIEGHFPGVVIWMLRKDATVRLCTDPLPKFMASDFQTGKPVCAFKGRDWSSSLHLAILDVTPVSSVVWPQVVSHLSINVGSLLKSHLTCDYSTRTTRCWWSDQATASLSNIPDTKLTHAIAAIPLEVEGRRIEFKPNLSYVVSLRSAGRP